MEKMECWDLFLSFSCFSLTCLFLQVLLCSTCLSIFEAHFRLCYSTHFAIIVLDRAHFDRVEFEFSEVSKRRIQTSNFKAYDSSELWIKKMFEIFFNCWVWIQPWHLTWNLVVQKGQGGPRIPKEAQEGPRMFDLFWVKELSIHVFQPIWFICYHSYQSAIHF